MSQNLLPVSADSLDWSKILEPTLDMRKDKNIRDSLSSDAFHIAAKIHEGKSTAEIWDSINYAKASGLPLETVMEDKSTAVSLAYQKALQGQSEELIALADPKKTPTLIEYFNTKPAGETAAMIMDKPLWNFEATQRGVLGEIAHSYEVGNYEQERLGLAVKAARGMATEEDNKRRTVLLGLSEAETRLRDGEGLLDEITRGSSGLLPQFRDMGLNILYRGVQGAAVGMAANAAIGAVGGGTVGTVVPGVGTAVGGAAGAATGAVVGASTGAYAGVIYGSTEHTYNMAVGEIYDSIENMTDDSGNKVDPFTASAIAHVGALPMAGLDLFSFKKTLKLVPGMDKFLEKGAVEAATKYLRDNPRLRAAVTSAGVNVAKAMGTEAVTESLQEGVVILSEEYAKSTGHLDIAGISKSEAFDRMLDAGRQALTATLPYGIGGGAVRAHANRRIQQAQSSAAAVDKLQTLVAESETVRHAPDMAQEYVQRVAEEGGLDNLYVRPEAVQRVFFQSEEGIAKAAEMGITPDMLLESLSLDLDMAIPMDIATIHVLNNEQVYNELRPDIRTAPDILTLREAETYSTAEDGAASQMDQEGSDFLDSIFSGLDDAIAANEKRTTITAPYVEQLINSGYTESQAQHLITPFMANAEQMAGMFNQTPEEYLQQRLAGFQLTSPKLAGMTAGEMDQQAQKQFMSAPLKERNPLLSLVHGRLDGMDLKNYDSQATKELRAKYGTGLFKKKNKGGVSLDLLADEAVRGGLLPEGSGANELLMALQSGRGKFFQSTEANKNARGSIDFYDTYAVISLFKGKKNLSTVIHEGGHFFLENLREAAQLENAAAWVHDSWKTLQQEYGFDGFELSEAVHERFAKAFESYAKSGKTPSSQLQTAFRQFSLWLTKIYRSVKSLVVPEEISADIRKVFDRLLATQEEIEAAQEQGSSVSLENMEASGLEVTPELKGRYALAVAEAHNKAAATIEARRMIDQQQLEKQFRAEAEARIAQDPFYMAEADVRSRGGIKWASVLSFIGEDLAEEIRSKWEAPFTKGFFKNNGTLDFADVAADFNVDSPQNLAGILLYTPTRQEAVVSEVQQAVAEWNQNFDGSMEHSNAMDAAIAVELEALTGQKQLSGIQYRAELDRRMGVKKASAVDAEYKALKESLRKQESAINQVMRDAHAGGVLAGEMHEGSKRAKERKGWQDRLAELKAQERAKRAALAAAYRARIEREKLTRQIRKDVGSKSVNDAFRQQTLALVAHWRNLGTDGMIPRDIQNTPSLADFIKQQDSLFGENESLFPYWIMAEGNSIGEKSAGDLTLEQLRELKQTIRIITHQGRNFDRLLAFGKEVQITEAAGEMVSSMNKMAGTHYQSEQERSTFQGKIRGFLRGVASELTSMRYIFSALDGYVKKGGAHYKYIVTGLQNAMGREQRLTRLYFEKLAGALSRLDRPSTNTSISLENVPLLEKYTQPENRKGFVIEGVKLPEDVSAEWGGMFTHEKVISIALNMGNAGNLKALMRGFNWSMEDLQRIVSRLKVEELQAVQEIWDIINELYPLLNETHVLQNGTPLAKVQSKGITIAAADGEITLGGGYYPLMFDHALSRKAEEQLSIESANSMEAVLRTPNPKSGMTKERKGGTLPPKLSLGVIRKHVADTIHYTTHAPILRDVHRITQLPEYRRAFIQAVGLESYNELTPWLRHIARPDGEQATKTDRVVEWMAKRGTLFVLAVNMKSALLQLTSLGNSITEVGATQFVKGVYQVMSRPRSSFAEVRTKSAYMESRGRMLDSSLKDWLNRYSEAGAGGVVFMGKHYSMDQVHNAQFAFIQGLDAAVAYPTWIAAYDTAIAEGVEESQAINQADEAVIRAQGSGGAMDVAHILRRRGFIKLFTPFMSFALNDYNRKQYYVGGFREYLRGGNSDIDFKTFAAHFMLEWVTPVVLTTMLLGLGRDGELPDTEDFIWEAIGFLTMGIPLVRDAARYAEGKFTGKGFGSKMGGSVAFAGIESGIKAAEAGAAWLYDDDSEAGSRMTRELVNTMGYVFGIGTPQIWRTMAGSEAYFVDGEGGILAPLLGKPQKD